MQRQADGKKARQINVHDWAEMMHCSILLQLMEDPERMAQELANLHGRDYFRVYFDAQAYVRPKFSSIEFNGDVQVTNEVASRINALINSTSENENDEED